MYQINGPDLPIEGSKKGKNLGEQIYNGVGIQSRKMLNSPGPLSWVRNSRVHVDKS